jgi:hypothetical protein
MQDPYSAALGGFSKVTHFIRDTLLTPDLPASYDNNDVVASEAQSDVISAFAVNTSAEAGFEIVTAVANFKL